MNQQGDYLVSSACDTCKRRKLKCVGAQPCQRCQASGTACTYGNTATRMSPADYVKFLERQVAELQQQQQQQAHSQQAREEENVNALTRDTLREPTGEIVDTFVPSNDGHLYQSSNDMSCSYHGGFGGVRILGIVFDMCSNLARSSPLLPSGREMEEAFDSSTGEMSGDKPIANTSAIVLPSRDRVLYLASLARERALPYHDCIDWQLLHSHLDRVYEMDPDDHSHADRSFLALVYALIALGRRIEVRESILARDLEGTETLFNSYFQASNQLLDIVDCTDLDSIRAIVLQSLYFLSCFMLSKAYARLCAGVAAAIRMGLHVSSAVLDHDFPAEQRFRRRQVFAVVYVMDTYLSSTLGIPRMITKAATDQLVPLRDEDMHDQGRSYVDSNPQSSLSITILMTQLIAIQARILTLQYGKTIESREAQSEAYYITYADVQRMEAELHEWHTLLPVAENVSFALNPQLVLRLMHATVQLALYRPFLHHLLRNRHDENFNYQGYACASACVRAAMQVVLIVETLEKNGILHEVQWFHVYLLTQACSILMLFVLGTNDGPTILESKAAAYKAYDLLSLLAPNCRATQQSVTALNELISSLEQERNT